MATVLTRCIVLFKLKVYGKINVFIPKNTLLLSKGCFLLLLLNTRTYTEYTVKVVSVKIPIQYYL